MAGAGLFTPLGIAAAVAYPLVSGTVHSLLAPGLESIAQGAWFDDPVLYPDVGSTIRANMAGYISNEAARLVCWHQGVRYWGDKPPEDNWLLSHAWRAVALNNLHRPGPSTYIDLLIRGLEPEFSVKHALKKIGANETTWLEIQELAKEVPGADIILRMWRMGLIDVDEARKQLKRAGCDVDKFIDLYQVGIEWPGVSAAMHAYARGRISADLRDEIVKRNGASAYAWGAMQDEWAAYPGTNETLRALVRGRITPEQAERWVAKAGGKWEEWSQILGSFEEMPLPQMALQALARNRVSQEFAEAIVRQSGGDWATWSALMPSMQTVLSTTDTLEAANRGLIGPGLQEELLKLNGVTDANALYLLDRLRERMPSPFELVQMGTRGAFTPAVANAIGLYDGQPNEMRLWMNRIGLHAPTGLQIVADGLPREASVGDLFWASARRGLSLETAIQAYRRLRPEAIADVRKFIPDAPVFTREMLHGWMRYNDIPQSLHSTLEELGYLPLSLREIRTVVRLKTRDKEWVIGRLQDQGHRRDRAEDLYDILADQERWRQEAPLRAIQNSLLNKVAQEVMDQYSVGTVDRHTARDYMINARVNAEVVDQMLNVIDAKLASSIAREGIKAVRRDYLNGTLNATEVQQQLSAMGIVDQRVRDYVALWTIQRNRVRRTATTANILSWVSQGILDARTAELRLLNLGWDRPDIVVQLSVAQGKLAQQEARAHSTEDKRRLAAAKELTRVQKENEKMRRQLEVDQRRATPRSVLDKWLCSGAISESFYLNRMQSMGFDARTSQEYLEVALAKKACQPAPEGTPFPNPPAPPEPAKPDGG
jgi:hypothetical protein